MEAVRLGIIGVGGMGTSHSRYLRAGKVPRCELVAACDVDPAKLEPFKDLNTFTDSKELIRSGEVDAVIIATPHYDHTTIGIDALEQGLHVLVEKPISVHKADCERLIAAHKKAKDQVFAVMFQMRTRPPVKRIKQLIDDGEIGEIRRTIWIATKWFRTEAYYASGGWRATWKGEGGGILCNQCPHDLDLFQWWCGMPTRIRANCTFGKFHNIEVEDDVTAYLEYENGATAVFIASTGEAPGTSRIEIAGDRGRLIYEDNKLYFRRNTVSTDEFCKTSPEGFGRPEAWDITVPIGEEESGHYVITRGFVEAILDGKPLPVGAEEGIKAVELANAMIYSSLLGETVDLPLDGAAYEAKLKELIANSRFEKGEAKAMEGDFAKSFQ